MFSIFSKKKTGNDVAVFTVDSGSVALTVTRIFENEAPRIIFFDRREIDVAQSDTPADSLRKAVLKIEQIFVDILSKKIFHLISRSRALVLLGSPWNMSWREKLVLAKSKPFRITKNSISDTIKEKFKTAHDGLTIVSSHLMEVSLNGYKIDNPIDKVSPSLELDVYIESASKEVLDALGGAIQKHLPHSDPHFSTIAYASAEAVSEAAKEKNFILILPEHSMTEIALVRDGGIKSSASIPFGTGTLSKSFSVGDANARETLLKIRRYLEGKADPQTVSNIALPLELAKSKFDSDFRNVLWQMNDSICPSIVYVGGRSIAAHFLELWISKEEYASQTFASDCFKVSRLSGDDIASRNSFAGKKLPFYSAVSAHAAKVFLRSSSDAQFDVK